MQLFSGHESHDSSVDCTLSLATPSTRAHDHHHHRSRTSNFSADHHCNNFIRGGGGGDTLLARRCANCDTTSTPLWRNGPRGPKSLCNACGIRYKKEERRASANANTPTTSPPGILEHRQQQQYYGYARDHYLPPPVAAAEFRFMDDNYERANDESAGGIPSFLSWGLNYSADVPLTIRR
ncbi:GATA transcription factor 20 [Linum perenne]